MGLDSGEAEAPVSAVGAYLWANIGRSLHPSGFNQKRGEALI